MATVKQKKAFKKVVENGRPVSVAMVEAGYSKNTAVVPQKLTNSKGWKELMDEFLPDELLTKRHNELLNKREQTLRYEKEKSANGKEKTKVIRIDLGPDVQAVSKGLDMAYKLGDKYAAEKHVNLNVELEASTEIKELTDKLNALHRGTG